MTEAKDQISSNSIPIREILGREHLETLRGKTSIEGKGMEPFFQAFLSICDIAQGSGISSDRILGVIDHEENRVYRSSLPILSAIYKADSDAGNKALDTIVEGLVDSKLYVRLGQLFWMLEYSVTDNEKYHSHKSEKFNPRWFEDLYKKILNESPQEARDFAEEIWSANQKSSKLFPKWRRRDNIKWHNRTL